MSEIGRLPAFIIGGAPRSGTTLLCHLLERHPDVYLMQPYTPEPKVFVTPNVDGTAEYLRRYARGFAATGSRSTLGEKTSYYLENEHAAEQIAATLGRVRMLFIVREPVQRAYSNFLWSRRNGLETLAFADAVAQEGRRPNPLGPERAYARPFDYLTRGDYASFAARYFRLLGRDRVRFVLYEDLERRPVELLDEIQEFIGVDPLPLDARAAGLVNAARQFGEPLDSALAGTLRDRMAPLVARFRTITGIDVSPWGYGA